QTRPRWSVSSIRSPTADAARSTGPTSDRSVSARWSLRTRASREREAFHQPLKGALRAGDRSHASPGDREVALRASASLCCGIAVLRRNKPLFLEPVERGVEGAGRGLALGSLGDLTADRDAVGVVAKAKDGEKDDLLEFTEGWRGGHLNYIVVSM